MTRLVLIPSPMLGPAVWAPVAARLREHGHAVSVAALPGVVASPADVVRGLLGELAPGEPVTLVPHSNAGLYVAALAAERPVERVVFVDAGLPSDRATTPVAPPAFRAFLEPMADDDALLPPWTRWWPSEDVDVLFPDAGSRVAVEREQRRLPLAYFDAVVPSPPGWERLPAAYLAFGDTYADERAEARRRGWPVETLVGEHLHPLVDPVGVAEALVRLLGRD